LYEAGEAVSTVGTAAKKVSYAGKGEGAKVAVEAVSVVAGEAIGKIPGRDKVTKLAAKTAAGAATDKMKKQAQKIIEEKKKQKTEGN